MLTYDPTIEEYRPFMEEANRRVAAIKPDHVDWLLNVWYPFRQHGWKSYEVRRNSGTEMSPEEKKANGLGRGRMSYELWEAMTPIARNAPLEVLDDLFLTAGRLHALARQKQDLLNDTPDINEMFPNVRIRSATSCAAAKLRDGEITSRQVFIADFPLALCDKNACICMATREAADGFESLEMDPTLDAVMKTRKQEVAMHGRTRTPIPQAYSQTSEKSGSRSEKFSNFIALLKVGGWLLLAIFLFRWIGVF